MRRHLMPRLMKLLAAAYAHGTAACSPAVLGDTRGGRDCAFLAARGYLDTDDNGVTYRLLHPGRDALTAFAAEEVTHEA